MEQGEGGVIEVSARADVVVRPRATIPFACIVSVGKVEFDELATDESEEVLVSVLKVVDWVIYINPIESDNISRI